MDGTLVDSLYYWDFFWEGVRKKGMVDKDVIWDSVTEKAIRTVPVGQAIDLIYKSCRFYCTRDELLDFSVELCKDFYSYEVKVKDGVMEFLEAAHAKGIKMCVASATEPELLDVVIKRFGFDRYFPEIFSCGVIGVGKDRPDIFNMAREYLGTSLDETWIFEDSVTAVETAVKAGYRTVGVYDVHAFNFDTIERISDECIRDGETMAKLISKI